jgi:ribose transport system ATP-binding protein
MLEMQGISKHFGGVRALDDVSFDCRSHEVHAICGENGAGKSTLMKVLGGAYHPDAGAIRLGGEPVAFTHPSQARHAGVSIIHQELSLLPDRSVADNIFLGIEPTRYGVLDRAAMRSRTRALLARVGARLHPDSRAGDLSIAEQQLVEIAKALALDARILVMDEPTAALDDQDAARLLRLIRELKEQGVAIVYISHRMPEVMAIADRVTVLKDGRRVDTRPIAEVMTGDIVRMMVGRELAEYYPPPSGTPGDVILEVTGGGNDVLGDIDLTVRAGEILGVSGLEGSGKTALGRALFGDAPFSRGTITLNGEAVVIGTPRAGIRRGIGYLPDDRKGEGIAPLQSLRDNALITLRAFAAALRNPRSAEMADSEADRQLTSLDVRATSFEQEIQELSGGNQQKVIIARWLARDPKILIFAEPTRGIDVAAKAAIYRIMRALADRGRAIVMISSDLLEIVGVSDRIVVMRDGRIAGVCPSGSSEEAVMELALGHAATGMERA